PGGTTSAMRRESPPDPTVLVASEAISSGARMSTSSSASARRWCRRSATPPCDWMLPRSCVTSSRQRSRWPSGRRSRVARFASSRISWWRGSPGSNIVRSVPPMSDPSAILPGMLELLRVRAFAIIEELEVHFEPGFNVLTGETGAGKSILVDALHLVLGGRAQSDVVRTGAEEAEVQALFRPRDPAATDARLAALGLPAAGGELVVRRTVQREGRSRAWVNGALATAAQLAQATRGLLDISGQHEHVGLLDAQTHLALLDGHAGVSCGEYEAAFLTLAEAERERARLDSDESARAERASFLRYQLDELEKADPKAGEDEALAQERRVLAAAEKLRGGAEEAEALLRSGDEAAVVAASRACKRLDELAGIDPSLAAVAAAVRGASAELDEAGRTLARYAGRAGSDPHRLEAIEERLELLRRLARKHGGSLAAALQRRETMNAELQSLEHHDESLAAAQG